VKARQVQLQKSVRNAWKVGEPAGQGPNNHPPKTARPTSKQKGWGLIDNTRRKIRTA
jgi:hypothetical protein